MKRWYITKKGRREAEEFERVEMGLPRYDSKRSPKVYIEWTEYLNVRTRCWHLEHLFASAFASQASAQKGLERLRGKIEYEVVTVMMTGNRKEREAADEISLLPDAEPKRVPKRWPKDRRKVPMRVIHRPNRWPYNKEKSGGHTQLERRRNQELS